MSPRLYFDHAATCVPKSPVIMEAMAAMMAECEASAGRGAYRASREADAVLQRLRGEIARWIDAEEDREVSLQPGGTEALNAAIFGRLRDGDHVVTTAAEHNSVLRPLHHWVKRGRIRWTVVPVDSSGQVDADQVVAAVEGDTRLVAVVHAANVNGAVQPIAEIGAALGSRAGDESGAFRPAFLVDAAQTFGQLPVSVRDCGIDFLAAPGHKGGSGPLGTGFLYARRAVQADMTPLVFGGTGSRSESLEMPDEFPESFEAGNSNVPAAAGWLAGLRADRGDASPQETLALKAERLRRGAETLYRGLSQISGVRLLGQPAQPALPVASLSVAGMEAAEVAMILDAEFGIEVRSGFHCAALVHAAIGSPADGTLRISASQSTSADDYQVLFEALAEIAGSC